MMDRSESGVFREAEKRVGGSTRRRSLSCAETEIEERLNCHTSGTDSVQHMIKHDPKRVKVYRVLETSLYQGFLGLCTVVSLCFLARETDLHAMGQQMPSEFSIAGLLLTFIFGIDSTLRLFVLQTEFVRGPINVLEALLVVLDVVLETSQTEMPKVFTALKVVRFLRLARTLRSASQLRDLYLMMMGVMASMRTMLFGTLMLFVTVSMFSTLTVYFVRPVCHELADEGTFENCGFCRTAFDSVTRSNQTLVMLIMGGDGWHKLAGPVMGADFVSLIIILSAFVTINLGIMNTIAAVIVDRHRQAREADDDLTAVLHQEDMMSSIKDLTIMFEEIDDSGDGSLDLPELLEYYDTNEMFKTTLNRVDIHKSELPVIFDILDSDASGLLSFSEFVNGLHSLKNQNEKTVAMITKHYCERLHANMARSSPQLRATVSRIEKVLAHMVGKDVFDEVVTKAGRMTEALGPVKSAGQGYTRSTDTGFEKGVSCGSSTCTPAKECSVGRLHTILQNSTTDGQDEEPAERWYMKKCSGPEEVCSPTQDSEADVLSSCSPSNDNHQLEHVMRNSEQSEGPTTFVVL